MVQRRQANQGGLVDSAPFVLVAAVAPAGGSGAAPIVLLYQVKKNT